MTTSDPANRPTPQPVAAPGWRDIAHASAEGGCADGLSLEHLIDMQRARANPRGEAR
ncbi:hypothetical protein [Citreimonas salinaria]|uniref:Uncharacterized protein n=1 Tax=Citreimonas salinaria TaxID=321339 RepID=A0A1H3MSF6_9RHOB|nr:hypothetical protein [Citreimonas salinaria]SDY78999.1 hypothetical protein SAMN05444340_11826 [Citreimonas salinaria]